MLHSTMCPRGMGTTHLRPRLAPAPRVARSFKSLRCQAVPSSEPVEQVYAASQPAYQQQVPPQQLPTEQAYTQPETTATYIPQDPRYYQGMPVRQQEYYAAAPSYYPPPPPTFHKEVATGPPWWVLVGAGVILGQVFTKVTEFMKNPKTPQQMMMEMAMKQMAGGMAGGSPFGPGASPFGPGAANPFGNATGNPFAGAAGNPFGPAAGNPFANFQQQPSGPGTVETTATTVQQEQRQQAPTTDSSKPGDKFASLLNNTGSGAVKPAQASYQSMDVVEPVVTEPPSSSGNSTRSSSAGGKARKFSFADVTDVTDSAKAQNNGANGNGNGASSSKNTEEEANVMSNMMEQMLRNPEMQKMLYPYLPEPMRNPSSIAWMLENPEVKKQMEQMFAQQNVMSPQMMEMMKGMDFNQDKVNKQFQELGLKPEDVIQKVMGNPELASGFSNPKVQAAIIDISGNPMNIVKYQNDPEVMKVLEKVTEIFQPGMSPDMRQ